jgi:hypothetical protein
MKKFDYIYDLSGLETLRTLIKQIFKLIFLFIIKPKTAIFSLYQLLMGANVSNKLKRNKYLDIDSSIDYLLTTGKSLIRWGDGDSIIVMGLDNHFEKYNAQLASDLGAILTNYTNTSDYLLAIPIAPIRDSFFRVLFKGKLSIWFRTRYLFNKYFDKQTYYLFSDAHMFRSEAKPSLAKLNILFNDKYIILVHPFDDYYFEFIQLFKNTIKSVDYIKVPEYYAYDGFDNIFNEVMRIAYSKKASKKEILILVTAGNVARVLVYRLSRDFTAYDIGSLDISHLDI